MKYTTREICADIASTMDRIRELDIEGHARAAALHNLAEAHAHLKRIGMYVDGKLPMRPIQTSPFPQVALASSESWSQRAQGGVPLAYDFMPPIRDSVPPDRAWLSPESAPSVPPSAADNQRVRNTATQAFRSARKILEGILK